MTLVAKIYNMDHLNNYLKYLTFEGAKKRYKDITDEIKERLDFELESASF